MDNTIMDGWDLLKIMVAFREFTSRSLTDFRIKAGGKHVQEIPEGWTAFVYTLLVPIFWDEIFMRQPTVFHTYLLIIRGHLSSATCQFKFSPFCTHPSLQGEFQFGGTTVAAHHTVLFQQSGGTVEMINVGEVRWFSYQCAVLNEEGRGLSFSK